MINTNALIAIVFFVIICFGASMAYLVDMKNKEIESLKTERYIVGEIITSDEFECSQILAKEKLKNVKRVKNTELNNSNGTHTLTF